MLKFDWFHSHCKLKQLRSFIEFSLWLNVSDWVKPGVVVLSQGKNLSENLLNEYFLLVIADEVQDVLFQLQKHDSIPEKTKHRSLFFLPRWRLIMFLWLRLQEKLISVNSAKAAVSPDLSSC